MGEVFLSAIGLAASLWLLLPTTLSAEESIIPSDHVGASLVDYLKGFHSSERHEVDREAVDRMVGTILTAVDQHPEVKAIESRVEHSGYAEEAAAAAYFPQIYGNSSSGYERQDGVSENNTTLGLGVNQLLYDFGVTNARVAAAQASADEMDVKLAGKRDELLHRGVKAWLSLYRSMEMVRLHQLNVNSRKEIADFVAQRAAMGGGTQSDVLRARARWADAEAGLARAEGQVEHARAAWVEVVGEEAPERVPLDGNITIDSEQYRDFARLAKRFALVASANAAHTAALNEANAIRSEQLPKFMLDLSVSRNLNDDSNEPDDRSAQVVIRYDFYQGGAKQARAGQSRALAVEAGAKAAKELRHTEKQLRQVWSDVESGRRAVEARRQAVVIASQSMEAVRDQFAYRRGTLLDLLRVQEDLFYAGRDLINAVVENAQAHYQFLYLASDLESYLKQ